MLVRKRTNWEDQRGSAGIHENCLEPLSVSHHLDATGDLPERLVFRTMQLRGHLAQDSEKIKELQGWSMRQAGYTQEHLALDGDLQSIRAAVLLPPSNFFS